MCPRLWDVPLHHLSIPGKGRPRGRDGEGKERPHGEGRSHWGGGKEDLGVRADPRRLDLEADIRTGKRRRRMTSGRERGPRDEVFTRGC